MKEKLKAFIAEKRQVRQMLDNDRAPVIWYVIAALVIAFTTAALIECLIFQAPSYSEKAKPVTFLGKNAGKVASLRAREDTTLIQLSDEEVRSIEVERNNQKLMREYLGTAEAQESDDTLIEKDDGTFWRKAQRITFEATLDRPMYIKKLAFYSDSSFTSDSGFSADLYKNGEQTGDTVYCSLDEDTGAGVANVGRRADMLVISFISTEKIPLKDLSFTLSNNFSPNIMRVFWMTALFLIAGFLLESRHMQEERPEWCFAFICFSLGMLLILGIGTNQVSYDEYTHAKSAYKLSFGTTIETTHTALLMSGNLLPFFHNPEERELVEAFEDKNHDYSWADIGSQSRFVRPETRVYYPMALGFFVGRIFSLSFATTIVLVKMGNLLCYIIVCFAAISLAKRYRELVALIALLPGNVFLAASISYDTIVNSFLLLGCVLLYNEFLEPENRLEWKNLLVMLLSFVIGCQSKPIYIIMVCMLVFYKRRKFENPVQEWVCKISVIVLALLMLYNIFKPTPAAGSDYNLVGNFDFAGDKRNVGSSVTGQISYIMSHPLAYTLLLLGHMGKMLFSYLIGGSGYFQYGYTGQAPMPATWLVIALAVFLAVFSPGYDEKDQGGDWDCQRRSIGKNCRILTLIMTFGMSAVIWTSMYVSYTAVGADEIRGVQGRYFMPLFLPLLLCLTNDKKRTRLGKRGRSRLLFGVMAGLNMLMILILVIYAYDV